jgi:hypothetical protein
MFCEGEHIYSELCRAFDDPAGLSLTGTVLATEDGTSHELHYELRTDPGFQTQEVTVTQAWPKPGGSVRLARDASGRWRRGSRSLSELIDVDLGFSPSTNTLPIRRLGLAVGERREISVLWVLFPGLSLQRAQQSYERLGEDRYLYRSGALRAILEVNDRGFVTDYQGLWSAKAVRRWSDDAPNDATSCA